MGYYFGETDDEQQDYFDNYDYYCEHYAEYHPIYDNVGNLIGYEYPNGSIKYIDD